MENKRFIKIIEIQNAEIMYKFNLDEKYLENFYEAVFLANISKLNSLIPEEITVDQNDGENVYKTSKKRKNKSKNLKIDKNTNISACYCTIYFKEKSFKFLHSNLGYFRAIIFFIGIYLVIFDYINIKVCFIDISKIEKVILNESRLMMIIYINYDSYYEKLVLFTEEIDNEEADLFKKIYSKFLEFRK